VLEMAVLGLLKEQHMHGYELKKQLAEVFGLSGAVSFGSLYPALARLEAAGAVSVVEAAETGRRRRKVYGITAAGTAMFDQLLTTSQGAADDERAFNLRLAFARYLPPEARLGLLEQRRAVVGERLAQMAARARARRNDHYVRVVAERQQESLRRDVNWLEQLIRDEKAGGAARPGGRPPGPGAASEGTVPPALGGAMSMAAGLVRAAARHVPLASASQLQRAARGGPEP
jgi:DNA-binding PadR family transcriptional regulator